ncbi:putative MFS-type transporter YdeG [Actinomycetes bacterium]|nr:putative MFS-type transporter YdeG [Actinomycetes bacterium]
MIIQAALPTDQVAAVQRRTIAVLSTAQILSGIAIAGAVPVGALLAGSIAGSDAAAGLAQTFTITGSALIALPLARIALSRGRRVALSTGFGIGAVGAVVIIYGAVLRSLALVYLGCLIFGVASAAGYQARYSATDLAPESHRARALSWVVWAGTIGAVLGPNLLNFSGSVGMALGLPQLSGPYVISGITLVAATIVLFLLLRPDPYLLATANRAAISGVVERPRLQDALGHVRGRPRAILGIAAVAIGHVVMVMVMVMTPIHMAHVDVSLQLIGFVISVHVAGMYAFSPVVGWGVDRLGRIQVIVIGIGILAAACVISGLAPGDNTWQLGIGLFLLGLGWSCTLIAGSTLLTDEVAAPDRPAAQGLSDLIMNVAGGVGGAAAGVIVLFASYGALCGASLVPLIGFGVVVALPACRRHSNTRSI